jgi:PKD repeat protein
MAVAGDSITRQQDTLPTVTEGSAGPNQTWMLNTATPHVTVTTDVMAPSLTPYAADFSTSNLSMTNDGVGFIYLSIDVNNLITTGAAGDLLGTGEIIKAPFNPDLTLNQYSTDYGDNYVDTYSFNVIADGSTFSTLIDSIRLKHFGTIYDTCDGWGTTKTPVGDYNSLRVKRVEHSLDSIWTKAPTVWPFPPPDWTFFGAFTDTSTTYTWLAKEGKLSIAELTFDSLDIPNVFTWTLIPAIPVADFTYSDNGNGGFSFTDQSINTPTTWAWDFGDGNNSTSQNPSNQYVADGTYNVCVTITNASGSDTFCDSVIVTGATPDPPPVANFSFTDNGAWQLDFTDLSLNTPTLWAWTFGDGNTSSAQNPINQYTSYGAFQVCLTVDNGFGNDMFCDSVSIADTAAPPQAPVASFTWFDNGNGMAVFTDASTNTPTSWSWNFGDGNTATVQNTTNIYAVVDTTYNVCLTATNGVGNDTYCDSVYVADTTSTPGIERIQIEELIVIPNPASEIIRVKTTELAEGGCRLAIYNMLGQPVYMERIMIHHNVDIIVPVSSLSVGLYMINLELSKSVYTGKISIKR